jgi:hypothetical protein
VDLTPIEQAANAEGKRMNHLVARAAENETLPENDALTDPILNRSQLAA